ncbi:MAG: Undecaprenyl diphosphate synthase, partial [uncultured Gemmatimonadetes bacterium]
GPAGAVRAPRTPRPQGKGRRGTLHRRARPAGDAHPRRHPVHRRPHPGRQPDAPEPGHQLRGPAGDRPGRAQAGGARGRGNAAAGRDRRRTVQPAAVHAGRPRSRPADPHLGRAAHQQLHALAAGVHRAVRDPRAVAGLRPRALLPRPAGLPAARAAVRPRPGLL